MTASISPTSVPSRADEQPRVLGAPLSKGDRVYRGVTVAGAMFSLVVMALIAAFLVKEAWPAMSKAGSSFFKVFAWDPDGVSGSVSYGVPALLFGTVVIAIIALVIAVPISVGTALFINEYAPRRIRNVLVAMIDLLAAVPSLIFGLWGNKFLGGPLAGLSKWLSDWLGFLPIFKKTSIFGLFGNSLFSCGVVLSFMIIPIITSISRAVMAEVPRVYCEAALALGGTRAGMTKEVILPFARGGVFGAAMLGLGRALGETIAVALIISPAYVISAHILEPSKGTSIAATIALTFQNSSDNGRSALVGAGLVLFFVTLVVNIIARSVVARTKVPAGAKKG